jgi:hypothetical protein
MPYRRVLGRGLGFRQRQILLMAWDRAQGGEAMLVQQDIFKQLYGWTITPTSWGAWFNPMEIGLAAYRTASGHVSWSITQLCKRGLLQRGARRGHLLLTPEGALQAQALAAKHQAAARTADSASRQGSLFPPTGTSAPCRTGYGRGTHSRAVRPAAADSPGRSCSVRGSADREPATDRRGAGVSAPDRFTRGT